MKQLFYTLSLLLLFACEMTKEIDYDIGDYAPKLIVHGYISPQDGVQVIVKTTTSPKHIKDDDKVNNAEIMLYNDDGEYLKLKQVNNDLFTSDSLVFINNNRHYYIRAKADGFEQIFSEQQTILDTPQIDSVRIITRDRTYVNIYFDNNYTDNERFYLNVLPYSDGEIDATYHIHYEKFSPYSMLDNIKQGSNIVEFETGSFYEYDSLLVELYVLSPDLVQFLISQDNYDFSKEDPFYPQPYPVYSNITGGYGIFASHSYRSLVIDISRK